MFGNLKHWGRLLPIALGIWAVCAAAALAAKPVTPAYTIVPFVSPLPPQGCTSAQSEILDLNDCGQAVGFEEFSDGSSTSVYQALHLDIETKTCTVLTRGRFATGVNKFNQIAGQRMSDGRSVGMFWKAPDDPDPVDLPPLSNDTQSWPEAINDAGIIAGVSLDDDHASVNGVVWIVKVGQSGVVSVYGPWQLPPLPGDPQGEGLDLNQVMDGSCQVTGASIGADDSREAAVWTVDVDGTVAMPGPAQSLVENGASSLAYGINMFGDACGMVGAGNKSLPFLAPAGLTAEVLPLPRYTQYGRAWDINNFGDIVGQLDIYRVTGWIHGPGNYYAYLWKGDNPIDLNTQIDRESGWGRLLMATAINDAGVIGGLGLFDIPWRGFVLIPNPK